MLTLTAASSGITFTGFWLFGDNYWGSTAIQVSAAKLFLRQGYQGKLMMTNFYVGIWATNGAWVQAKYPIIGNTIDRFCITRPFKRLLVYLTKLVPLLFPNRYIRVTCDVGCIVI
jgi:hypothetical protein